MTPSILWRIGSGFGSTILALGYVVPLWANAGPSSTPTNTYGEPVGIKDVRITRETLVIDLRPLQGGGRALVEAVYHLQNDGAEQELDLLFAFGSQDNSECGVTLNDQPIAGTPKNIKMPSDWRPPANTPTLDGHGDLAYGRDGWSTFLPLSFSVTLPSDRSVLAVRYQASVKHTFARPAMYRQFAYILAPARSWADFGGLDVKIHFPENWSVASDPTLQREGNLLQGSFDTIPADAIGITLRPPVAAGYSATKIVVWGLCALAVIAGSVLAWRWGGAEIRTKMQSNSPGRFGAAVSDLARSAGIGLACGALVLVTGIFAIEMPDSMFPPTDAERALAKELGLEQGYAALTMMFIIALLTIMATGIGGIIALTRRTNLRKRHAQ